MFFQHYWLISKAFGCIPNDLIIPKLAIHGFDNNSLKLIHNYHYLSNRKQEVKINSTYSIWKDIFYGVPQGSILEPMLFNIHLCETKVTGASLSFLYFKVLTSTGYVLNRKMTHYYI